MIIFQKVNALLYRILIGMNASVDWNQSHFQAFLFSLSGVTVDVFLLFTIIVLHLWFLKSRLIWECEQNSLSACTRQLVPVLRPQSSAVVLLSPSPSSSFFPFISFLFSAGLPGVSWTGLITGLWWASCPMLGPCCVGSWRHCCRPPPESGSALTLALTSSTQYLAPNVLLY